MNNFRHGDLIFTKLSELPKNLKKIDVKDNFALAYGEHTGHSHRLMVAEKLKDINVFQDEQGRYVMEVIKPVDLVHEEHKTITITPGIYIQEHEHEFDYFTKSIQKVID